MRPSIEAECAHGGPPLASACTIGRYARGAAFAVLVAVAAACDAVTGVAAEGADFGGAKADAYCDRRYVSGSGEPEAFCQEIVATVAASEFADDCRVKHQATAAPGRCPRPRIIAGCKLRETHRDQSGVWDWYYDVSDLADARSDGEPTVGSRARSVEDVAKMCADPTRYETGAELAFP